MQTDQLFTGEEIASLKAFIVRRGVEHAARELALGVEPMLRLVAGIPVRKGTLALARLNLKSATAAQAA